ncbi:MAG: hypothetical protein QXJ02_03165 [Candidatus Bathyarchaeia archaeon]
MKERRKGEQKLLKNIVVLIRNTTWRCGRLERLIVERLHRRRTLSGKSEMLMRDMLQNLELSGKKKNDLLDAIKRLERRNIIRILKPVGS